MCFINGFCFSQRQSNIGDNLQISDMNANVTDKEINEYTNDINAIKENASDNKNVISDKVLSLSNSDDKLSAPKIKDQSRAGRIHNHCNEP